MSTASPSAAREGARWGAERQALAGRSLAWADVLLVAVALVWGMSYGTAKTALVYYPVLGYMVIRFGLTAILLAPALVARRYRASLRATAATGVVTGALLAAIFICETYGIAGTRAANAAFLISLSVVFTPLLEAALFRRRPHPRALGLAALSALGALLLTSDVDLSWSVGDGLMLAAALLRAGMVTLTSRLTQGRPIDALPLTAVQSLMVVLASLLVLALSGGEMPPLPRAPSFWAATVFLVLFCTVFAFFAQNYAAKRISPSRVSLLMGAEPLFGALFACLYLGETLGPRAWLGAGAILVATMLSRQLDNSRTDV